MAEKATREALGGRLGRWIQSRLERGDALSEDVACELLADVILQLSLTSQVQIESLIGPLGHWDFVRHLRSCRDRANPVPADAQARRGTAD